MPKDKSFQPGIIPLYLSEAAKLSGINELYIENNIIVITIKVYNIEPFTERVTINHKRWHTMVKTLITNVRNMLLAKGTSKLYINELGFQIGNTLNQQENYSIFENLAKEQVTIDEDGSYDDAEALVKLASLPENLELYFKNQYGQSYVAVRVGNDKHCEILQLQSKKYEGYLTRLFYQSCGNRIIGKDALNRALNLLEANTIFEDRILQLNTRVAWGRYENRARADCIYYDMTDSQWRIVEISTSGWRVISRSDTCVPILFKRHNQTTQVEPSKLYDSDMMEQFLDLTNVRDKNHRQLLKVYIVSLLVPEIDHVILTTYGPKGAAKTFLLWLIKTLIDPSKPVLLTLLRNIPEFIQQVNHNYLAFYDNVKYIPYWLSDEICKVVTGIGHTKRKLFTDDEDIVLEHHHCIAINGIDVALTEPDAMDRSLFIKLEEIHEEDVMKKQDLVQEFEKIRSKLLGFIFDILVKAMILKPTLKLCRLPRMADFTEWGEAISRALGYEDGSFVKAYHENRNEQNIVAVEENIVGRILVKFYKNYEENNNENLNFIGSPEELYKELVSYAEQYDIPINNRQFPAAANVLVKKLNGIKSNLKDAYGIIICISRDGGNNSFVSISRENEGNDVTNSPEMRVIQNYYENFILRQHTNNYNNIITRTPSLTELTSDMSEPPAATSSPNGKAGGSEAPEVRLDSLREQSKAIYNIPEPAADGHNPNSNKTTNHVKEIISNNYSSDFQFTMEKLLETISGQNGSNISFNSAVEIVYYRDERIKAYLGEKITFQENKIVRDLAVEIIHNENIEVKKTRPQIILRWKESNKTVGNDAI